MLKGKLFGLLLICLPIFIWGQEGPPAHSAWDTTFTDEFNGPVLDEEKWDFGFGWGTNSGAFMEINRPENVYVEDGNLVIRVDSMPGGDGWWSGAVNTRNHFSQHKGYFEARMKMAKGNGYVNAFWSKPITEKWPPEIDFVEVLGRSPTDEITLTVHYDENGHKSSSGVVDTNTDLSDDFHIYGFEWSDKEFIWYFDGQEVRRTSIGYESITGYDHPFYIMLNVHVVCDGDCSGWTGWPDETNEFPAYMHVDWVRAYQVDVSLEVEMESPVNDQVFTPGEDIQISTNAYNSDGIVSRVVLYSNENKIGEMSSAPYNFTWTNAPRGRYKIEAVAYDEKNRTTYSEPVYITVGNINDNLILNPYFDSGTDNWNLINIGTADATLDIVTGNPLQGENTGVVNISNPGNLVSDIQLIQPLYLKKDVEYNLSFLASAQENRNMIVTVKTEAGKSYQMLKSVSLTNQPVILNYQFTSKVEDYTASLAFSMGGSATQVMIDSVVLNEKATNIMKEAFQPGTVLYPNPAGDKIMLKFNNVRPSELQIIDLAGKVMGVFIHDGGNSMQISINSLNPGVYFMKVVNERGIEMIRFCKR